jgi:hypothetical protein
VICWHERCSLRSSREGRVTSATGGRRLPIARSPLSILENLLDAADEVIE